MIFETNTFTIEGIAARPVQVEADIRRGLPHFQIIGLPDAAVRECRERVRAALVNSGFEFPLRRITVNLSPADLRKCGPAFDLAVAAAILAADGQIDQDQLQSVVLLGELALDGSVRPVRGALAFAEAARDLGRASIVVPEENGPEAALANEIRVWSIRHVGQLRDIKQCRTPEPALFEDSGDLPDLADLRGNENVRKALEVAAAGGHGMLMVGPPGSGKSLAARRFPSILPPLTTKEAIEVARIASISGLGFDRLTVSGRRPFRAPHHTVSAAGLIGSAIRPGEITLAHRGVLFLDELVEFSRTALEALRQPLSENQVTVARSNGRVDYPANFQLLAGTYECACGHGPASPDCRCSPASISRYQDALANASRNGFAIRVKSEPPTHAELAGNPGESSETVRERVLAARERMGHRYETPRTNAEANPEQVFGFKVTKDAYKLLEENDRRVGNSLVKLLVVSRTIADLADEDLIREEDVTRAIAFTSPESLVRV